VPAYDIGPPPPLPAFDLKPSGLDPALPPVPAFDVLDPALPPVPAFDIPSVRGAGGAAAARTRTRARARMSALSSPS
jgi:hypothetical protein